MAAPLIRLATMSLLWNIPKGENFVPWLKEVKSLGYEGVTGFAEDWGWGEYLKDAAGFGAMLKDHGLELASLDINLDLDFDRYRRVCDFMNTVGCRHLVCIGGQGTETGDLTAVAAILDRVGGITTPRGIMTHYHNRAPGSGALFRDYEKILLLTDPSRVAWLLDTGHATRDFTDLPDVGKRASTFIEKHGMKLKFVEVKDWNPETDLNTPLGEGLCDLGAVFRGLQKHSYGGWMLLEQNGMSGLSRGRPPGECARINIEYARRHLRSRRESFMV